MDAAAEDLGAIPARLAEVLGRIREAEARAGRPVLAQSYGLVGRLTRDHRLGRVADSSDPVKLAAEIQRMVDGGPQSFIDLSSAADFAASRTPQRFASQVMACADDSVAGHVLPDRALPARS